MDETAPIDSLTAEHYSPLGECPLVAIELDRPRAEERARALAATQAIVIGIDRAGALPAVDARYFAVLLTSAAAPPAPWVAVAQDRIESRIARMNDVVRAAPHASAICMGALRTAEQLPFPEALAHESLAYSALLGGAEFRAWLSRRTPDDTPAPPPPDQIIKLDRDDDLLTITLDHPAARNAISAPMRDALFAALAAAIDEPDGPAVLLRGAGACFSVGGELREFGSARDLAQAHHIRLLRSSAALLHRLGSRARVHLHGACIGSGIEIPAAAARRSGNPNAFFQLPELTMGLMPGAGGTVSVPRCIGRHRTAYMVLTAERIRAGQALDWGLLHTVEEP